MGNGPAQSGTTYTASKSLASDVLEHQHARSRAGQQPRDHEANAYGHDRNRHDAFNRVRSLKVKGETVG